jgi:hypothetical protein
MHSVKKRVGRKTKEREEGKGLYKVRVLGFAFAFG